MKQRDGGGGFWWVVVFVVILLISAAIFFIPRTRMGLVAHAAPVAAPPEQQSKTKIEPGRAPKEDGRRATSENAGPAELASIVGQHADRETRLAALEKLGDQDLLADLVSNAADMEARRLAMAKITNAQLLARLEPWVSTNAAQKVTDPVLLTKLTTRAWLAPIRKIALAAVSDVKVIERVALGDPSGTVRKEAVVRLSDPRLLAGIATNDAAWYVRRAALGKIDDADVIAGIARNDTDALVSLAAVSNLTSEASLVDVALLNEFPDIRKRAADRLTSEQALAKVVAETRDAELRDACYRRISDSSLKATASIWVDPGAAEKVADPTLLGRLAQHAIDCGMRKRAVERLNDSAVLERIALGDEDESVRVAAAGRLQGQVELRNLVRKGRDDVRAIAVGKLSDQQFLAEVLGRTNEVFAVRKAAVEGLRDPRVILGIAEDKDMPDELRLVAIGKLSDPETLARIARTDENWSIRQTATQQISNATVRAALDPWINPQETKKVADRSLLAKIAMEARAHGVREAAIGNLADPAVLLEIAQNTNNNQTVRAAAAGRLTDQAVLSSLVRTTNTPYEVRSAAIQNLMDPAALADVAQDKTSPQSVRLAAVKRLEDQPLLARLAISDRDEKVREIAKSRITDERALASIKPWISSNATREVADPALLARIAREANVAEVRKAAVQRLSDPVVLAEVAVKDSDKETRRLAAERVSDQTALEKIARNGIDEDVKKIAAGRLTNQNVLAELARNETNDDVRRTAFERLTDPTLLEETASWVRIETARKIDDRILLARMARTAGDTNIREAAVVQLTGNSIREPQVAYEWLSHQFRREGKNDDAVLALLMATVAYDQDSEKNAGLSLTTFQWANELRSRSALQTGLSALNSDGASEGKMSLVDVATAVNRAAQEALHCQDGQLVSDVSSAFRQFLDDKEGGRRGLFSSDEESTNAAHFVTGDVPFVSALGLAWLQRREDWSSIERFLASDAYNPMFTGYLRAMAAQDPAFEQVLFSHPSTLIRANALIALGKPAPAGETNLLLRCAGAWNPATGRTNEAVKLLQGALTDELHVVRTTAMRGLLKLDAAVPIETITRAITTSAEWRKKFTLGCMALVLTSAKDPSLVGRVITFQGSAPSENAVDCALLQAGYALVANQPALSDDAFAWLLNELKLKPGEGYPTFYLSSASSVGGYRIESAQALSADQVNAGLVAAISKHAPNHGEQLLAALRQADPYARMILLPATEPLATNVTMRARLWRIAESGAQTPEEKAYRDKLYGQKVEEVRKGLMWNQTVNYSAVGEFADKLTAAVWKQSRRTAVNQLGATAEDPAEFERLGALFQDGQVSRAVLLLLMGQNREFQARYAPIALLKHHDAEVRMCTAIAQLIGQDSAEARTVLTDVLKGDEDRVNFAARAALLTKTPALAEAVCSASGIEPVSVAGYLMRRLGSGSW
ncbi:MAG TPA: hypothetical protein PLU30_25515 [Verrucomicrobiae bacterium]|nr:hypothetical protein [Verrucomicrobiae bacterium]